MMACVLKCSLDLGFVLEYQYGVSVYQYRSTYNSVVEFSELIE